MIVNKEKITEAVAALTKYVGTKKKDLSAAMDDPDALLLQFTLKKIASRKNPVIKIQLPNSMLREQGSVCLFVKDLDSGNRDYQPTVKHFKKLLKDNKVQAVSEIVPLKALHLEYRPYEAKKNLSNMHDAYLADARILGYLPKLLGKAFYQNNKRPFQVNLDSKNIKEEFTKVFSSTQCVFSGKGSCGILKVANMKMEGNMCVQNIVAALEKLQTSIPGGEINVRKLHLKTSDSPSLPIYISDADIDDVKIESTRQSRRKDEPEDVTTLKNMKVRVNQGEIEFFKVDSEGKLKKVKPEKKNTRKINVSNKLTKVAKKTTPVKSSKGESKKGAKKTTTTKAMKENSKKKVQKAVNGKQVVKKETGVKMDKIASPEKIKAKTTVKSKRFEIEDPDLFSDTTADSELSEDECRELKSSAGQKRKAPMTTKPNKKIKKA